MPAERVHWWLHSTHCITYKVLYLMLSTVKLLFEVASYDILHTMRRCNLGLQSMFSLHFFLRVSGATCICLSQIQRISKRLSSFWLNRDDEVGSTGSLPQFLKYRGKTLMTGRRGIVKHIDSKGRYTIQFTNRKSTRNRKANKKKGENGSKKVLVIVVVLYMSRPSCRQRFVENIGAIKFELWIQA